MTDEFDLELGADESQLDRLNAKVDEAAGLDTIIKQMEDDLRAARSSYHELRTKEIPDMMAEMGIEEVTRNGWKVKVEDLVSGSLPKDPEKREVALQTVCDYGAEGIIKTQIVANFDKGEHNIALAACAQLQEQGMDAEVIENIHPQTYLAFARERLKNGEDFDSDKLNLFVSRIAKLKEIK